MLLPLFYCMLKLLPRRSPNITTNILLLDFHSNVLEMSEEFNETQLDDSTTDPREGSNGFCYCRSCKFA